MMQLQGDAEVRKNIREVARQYPRAMSGAIYRLAVAIMGNAIPRVPVEYGRLRASAYVSPPQGEGVEADVELGFGTEYAVVQHERTDYRHPRGGEAKFLERAVYALSPAALQLLAKWAVELAQKNEGWGGGLQFPPRPKPGRDGKRRKQSQLNRLARSARNVRRRTGR